VNPPLVFRCKSLLWGRERFPDTLNFIHFTKSLMNSQTNRKRAQNKLLQLKVKARANAEKDRQEDEEMARQAGQADIEEDEISDSKF